MRDIKAFATIYTSWRANLSGVLVKLVASLTFATCCQVIAFSMSLLARFAHSLVIAIFLSGILKVKER